MQENAGEETSEFTDMPGLPQALQGQQYSRVRYSRDERAEVVEVLAPVHGRGRPRRGDHPDHRLSELGRRALCPAAHRHRGRAGPGPGLRDDPGLLPQHHRRAAAPAPDPCRRGVPAADPGRPAHGQRAAGGPGARRARSRACWSASSTSRRTGATCCRTSSTSSAGRWARCGPRTARCWTVRAKTRSCAATCWRGSTARSAGWKGCSTSWRACATSPPGSRRCGRSRSRCPSGWPRCWRPGARPRWPRG